MMGKVGGRSESTDQTAGMIGDSWGMVRIDGANSENDRKSWERLRIDGPNSGNDRKS